MSKSVIVIDDDEDTVRLFSEFLEENDIKVIGNGFDGVTAVKLFNETKPDLILELFSEPETRKIISALLENEYTIPEILKESKVPKTSGYRKVENLIINGLIIESGKVLSESKKISKLQCVFQEIKLDIKKEKITVIGVISKKMFEKSTSMKSIIETFA